MTRFKFSTLLDICITYRNEKMAKYVDIHPLYIGVRYTHN